MKVPSAGTVPVKIWPCSKRRTSFTSRLRLWASMFNMPGTSDGRRREASSERGFSMGTGWGKFLAALRDDGLASLDNPPFAWGAKDGAPGFWGSWKISVSWWLAKVLEMDSL